MDIETIKLSNFLKGFSPLGAVYPAYQTNMNSDPERLGYNTEGCNPFRFPNTLSPAPAKTNVTNENAITDTPKNIVIRNVSTGEAYMIGSGDGSTGGSVKFYKVTGTAFDTVHNSSPFPHAVSGAKNGYDCLMLTVNGKDYVFYSYDDGSDPVPGRNLGIYGDDFAQSWTTANKAQDGWAALTVGDDQHPCFLPMVQGETEGGHGYIGSGYTIDKIVVTAAIGSAFSAGVFALPKNYVITTLRPYKGFLAIGAIPKQVLTNEAFNGKAIVAFWDYVKATPDEVIYLDDNKITNLSVKDGGVLHAFTGKRDGYSKIQKFTGQSFDTVAEYRGSPPVHNAVDIYRNMFVFPANGQGWSFGRPNKHTPESLNCIDGDGSITGFIRVLNNSSFYEYHISGSAKFEKVSGQGSDGTSVAATDFIKLPPKSTIKNIRFYYLPLNSGAACTMAFNINGANTNTVFKKNSGVISTSLDSGINPSHKSFPQSIPNVDTLQLVKTDTSGAACVSITAIDIEYITTNKL